MDSSLEKIVTTALESNTDGWSSEERDQEILTPEALQFLRELDFRFEARRVQLLEARRRRQEEFDRGCLPKFLAETDDIRHGDWVCAPIPIELLDRRVEITGPPDRKMVINALNSGANVFMADFEDSNAPTWKNCIDGQRNLRDANLRTISWCSSEGRIYELGRNPAVLFMRPRGWHMVEKHLCFSGAPVSASLFDFGLYFFHNYRTLLKRGSAPYFYLPKLESRLEARLWNDVFLFAQEYVGIPKGTLRATVLIETIAAAFQMDEILYELRQHSAGLNCGRWDYIFSFIKRFRGRAEFVLPDRGTVTMEQPFLRSYVELLIHTCHRRGAHAMGGMAAQIPIRNDEKANEEAMERVRQDKLREVRAGHDGTWVAHPGLVAIAREVFDRYMPEKNQIRIPAEKQSRIASTDLLQVPEGPITEAGLQRNIDVALQYIESWLRGNGCVPIYNLMEDAATAEISRAQLWQWIHHGAHLQDGRIVTFDLVESVLKEVLDQMRSMMGAKAWAASRFTSASEILKELSTGEFQEFLTTAAYSELD
ncbi:MAG TPA: malate synthase A [Acidobacteriaceae bacterium]|nr:malate synthase A [Acidobacteriaceae bacterium]